MPPTISLLTTLDRSTHQRICELLTQLTTSSPAPSYDELAEVVSAKATVLLVAKEGDQLLGMLTLVLVRLPTARVGHIEDVVVDEQARGRGIGRLLAEAAVSLAARSGAKQVDLTSRPSREAANRLYQSLGFERRETNVYRYQFGAAHK